MLQGATASEHGVLCDFCGVHQVSGNVDAHPGTWSLLLSLSTCCGDRTDLLSTFFFTELGKCWFHLPIKPALHWFFLITRNTDIPFREFGLGACYFPLKHGLGEGPSSSFPFYFILLGSVSAKVHSCPLAQTELSVPFCHWILCFSL